MELFRPFLQAKMGDLSLRFCPEKNHRFFTDFFAESEKNRAELLGFSSLNFWFLSKISSFLPIFGEISILKFYQLYRSPTRRLYFFGDFYKNRLVFGKKIARLSRDFCAIPPAALAALVRAALRRGAAPPSSRGRGGLAAGGPAYRLAHLLSAAPALACARAGAPRRLRRLELDVWWPPMYLSPRFARADNLMIVNTSALASLGLIFIPLLDFGPFSAHGLKSS